jgi:hypothetical protein
MPKQSGESMKTVRTAPKPQPSRAINHQPRPAGPKVLPNAQGAPKRSDALRPSPKRKSPAGGSLKPQQVY